MSAATRARTLFVISAIAAIALVPSVVLAQDQSPPPTSRSFCIKVTPGKWAEFRAYQHDVLRPLNQARADAGRFAWYVAARSVVPAGSSATCDYRIVYGYDGLPSELGSGERLEADLKAAKINMTPDQFLAKRNSLTSLVSTEIWYQIDSVGPGAEKGNYVRLNHYKTRNGEMDEWIRMEQAYWKVLMEAWLKEGGKGSWRANGLWMPEGDSVPYDAMTVDIFPDWNGLLQGVPVNDLWPKALPGTTPTDTFNRMDRVRSVHDREVYQLDEVVVSR